MSAILFGSISTLVDTSELQRRAFNESFEAHGLNWNWSRDDYIAMLDSNGGAQRIADYAKSRGEEVDAAAVHWTKSQIFQEILGTSAVQARPGVVETIKEAKDQGVKLGFVTTTSPENVYALLTSLEPEITNDTFDIVVNRETVQDPKPDPASYVFALDQLGESSNSALAIEDNLGGVAAAVAAGLRCIAFPNQNTSGGDFSSASESVDALDAGHVLGLIPAQHPA
ncbi:MAG: HAD-IA family hydrolase [Mycobacterium sp.]